MRWWGRSLLPVALSASLMAGCTDPKAAWHRAGRPSVESAASEPAQGVPGARATEPLAARDGTEGEEDADASGRQQRVQAFLERLEQIAAQEGAEPAAVPPEETALGTGSDRERLANAPAEVEREKSEAGDASLEGPSRSGTAGAEARGSSNTARADDRGSSNASAAARPEKPRVEGLSIRTGVRDVGGGDEASRTFDTNAPLDRRTEMVEDALATAIDRLQSQVAETPNDLAAQWKLSLLQLVTGADAEAAEVSSEVTQEAAGLIADTVRLVAEARRRVLEPGPSADEALGALEAVRQRLVKDAELRIPKVALCSRVSTFGVYDEMAATELQPHRANRTIVYCELKNFHSQRTEGERFRVTLSSRLELLTAEGQSVWEHAEPTIEDVSRQQREDFFLAQLVTLPGTLAPGQYVLKVTIEDTTAGKACQALCPMEIAAPTVTSAAR